VRGISDVEQVRGISDVEQVRGICDVELVKEIYHARVKVTCVERENAIYVV
jgi:hypothetical protein